MIVIISYVAPGSKEVRGLQPLENGTFKLKFFGPAGENGASVTAIELITNAEGNITGGTATLSNKETIEITITKG